MYNWGTKMREFEAGDRVLLLLLIKESKLLARWQGPFEVVRRTGPVDYEVRLDGKRTRSQIYHVNLLKKWKPREALLITTELEEPEVGPWIGEVTEDVAPAMGEDLTTAQRQDVETIVQEYSATLTRTPGRTSAMYHHITTAPGKRVCDAIRPLPWKMWDPVQKEVQEMLRLGVIEDSQSGWRSAIELVPKPDGTLRFCVDFQKVNVISRFDAYPIPRVDELLDRLGQARYISTLDLTKGYWQIPLTPASREKTAFSTLFGLFQFKTVPFSLHGAAATFQRLMDRVLQDHWDYTATYIDDIVIYSQNWQDHTRHLRAVLRTLRDAGLTSNPTKCHIGQREVTYLGYTVGRGRLRPLMDKVKALAEYRFPTTKKQVRQFLGLAVYYRRFIPQFATIAAPLTDLTKAEQPKRVIPSREAERAFNELKMALMRVPVLRQPDFSREFIVQTDASAVGLGAVLAQEVDEEEHPILYMSRKLFPREKAYATKK